MSKEAKVTVRQRLKELRASLPGCAINHMNGEFWFFAPGDPHASYVRALVPDPARPDRWLLQRCVWEVVGGQQRSRKIINPTPRRWETAVRLVHGALLNSARDQARCMRRDAAKLTKQADVLEQALIELIHGKPTPPPQQG